MNDVRAKEILLEVANAYDDIASEFSDSRAAVWGEFLPFKKQIHDGDTILDVGCGNGRFIEFCSHASVSYVGIDNSAKLLAKAQARAKEFSSIRTSFQLANMQSLPFREGQFSVVLCIAALHHLPTRALRVRAVHELFRVLAPGGLLLLSNWYVLGRLKLIGEQILQRISHPSLYWGCGMQDFFIPWHLRDGRVRYRYYYGFRKREIERLLTDTGFELQESFISISEPDWSGKRHKRNSICVARRPS